MNDDAKIKTPPRGFVTFEAGAEMLWLNELEPDARWHIAFLRIVADSQGRTDIGKKADMRLDCWGADRKTATHVRASQVVGLRKAFAWWCGLEVSEALVSDAKPRRGRPKGSMIAGDETLVKRAIDLFLTCQAASLTDAARIVSEHALGASPASKYDRLRKKVVAEAKRRDLAQNN